MLIYQQFHCPVTPMSVVENMSRILLIIPPDPLVNRIPSIGAGYLAASLIDAGHDVRVFDAGAPFGPGIQHLRELYDSWRPGMVGVGLYTETALETYQLLAPLMNDRALWLAGGVHATAVPHEPLRFGFDVSVKGEGEQTIIELADLPRNQRRNASVLGAIPGITFKDGDGVIQHTPGRPRIRNLDRIPPPYRARHLFRRHWYLKKGEGVLPASLLTSRGCPGRCLFCSRQVTGRTHRVHSPDRVVEEIREHIEQEGMGGLSFHDDAFTANSQRLYDLCDAIQSAFSPTPSWWCESRVDHMDGSKAERMKAAGCCLVVFGVESGDPEMLRQMGKQVDDEAVWAAFAACRQAGLPAQANMMFGFPFEEVSHLENSLRFMGRLAPMVSHFSPLGLPIPFPGTRLYERYARRYHFTDWWLDPARIATLRRPIPKGGFAAIGHQGWPVLARQMEEAVLKANFFHYSSAVKAAIRRCLDFRQRYNRG